MSNNCFSCKNHILANGNCEKNIPCNKFIKDTEDIGTTDKLIRYMKKDYIIDTTEAKQLMCEMIDMFKIYNINDDYKFILNDCTYDCSTGFRIEKLNIKDWDKKSVDFGFNILIESDVYYMFKYDTDTFQEEQEFEGNIGGSKNYIQCRAKLRRLFKRYGLEYEVNNHGYLISFRKKLESLNEKIS